MKKLIPLLMLLVSMPSLAQRQFDIEVIVFKRAVNPEKVNESWPNDMPDIDFSRAGSLNDSSYRASKGVQALPSASYQLNDEVAKLRNHAGYTVLMHKAWRQGDNGKGSAPVFRFRAGKDFSTQFYPDGSEKGSSSNTSSPVDGVTEVAIDKPLYELDGKLQIYVQHYLYAEAQLDLKSPSTKQVIVSAPIDETPADAIESNDLSENTASDDVQDSNVIAGNLASIEPQRETLTFLKDYRLDQKRRMRSSETHYLDHPLMGMIIQVRRVQN
ncbi:peptidoglycan binding protein CsiV [Vibrio sp. SCSIO 43140]|uniref:peptidoglycan binding protein CsiV n=1 Tax=Vibrio sp. SCSIO 43140 TaxID=2819100 RepID=UPI00207541A3|nr:peptidoglycan binding protein CsiV [Vibrio sp. SCSIO 43140]USD59370.1 peptidoglycan binding protein CsiV [Vibrio sp. SCSIO 43140]